MDKVDEETSTPLKFHVHITSPEHVKKPRQKISFIPAIQITECVGTHAYFIFSRKAEN